MSLPRFLYACFAAVPLALSAADVRPVAAWDFERAPSDAVVQGAVAFDAAGPRPLLFRDFAATNLAASFSGKGGSLRVKDPGAKSAFDFDLGDTITIEAWVQCAALADGQQTYIIGKGRTQNPGVAAHNQNWALRVRGQGGLACASFLFRDARNRPDSGDADWHRWTSTAGFAPGAEWHHIAVSYTFGKGGSARGWLDGQPVEGAWDMGGQTDLGPVVDDDEVWIGSSMGGAPNSSFHGALDGIALYRAEFTDAQIAARFQRTGLAQDLKIAAKVPVEKKAPAEAADAVPPPVIAAAELPRGAVRVGVFEHAGQTSREFGETAGGNDSGPAKDDGGEDASWATPPSTKTDEFTEPAFAFSALTTKYNERGVKVDRSRPFLVRAAGVIALPPGEYRLLLRSLTGARLALDGQQLALTPHLKRKSGDAEAVPDQSKAQLVPGVRLLPPGHKEALATLRADGQPHVLTLEAFVGGKTIRPELGELSVSVSKDGGPFVLLALDGTTAPAFDDAGWNAFAATQHERIAGLNAARRRNPAEDAYWKMRHDLASQHAPQIENQKSRIENSIDAFIDAKLAAAKVAPAPVTDDAAFLRRVTLDVIGLLPTADEVIAFLADTRPGKRARAIDRLLADVRWADRWVPYWQDVLAENPSMLKGTLNNTGPFRVWLYEALRDNLPMDRFATGLLTMEGSAQDGGPAGFGVATQNDLPMAAKAQIVSSAFLAMEMKCARCHDAPNHPYDQADLFSLAAMLQRSPVKVPGSSLTQGLSKNSHVTVSLKAGQKIEPHWPIAALGADPLPGVIRRPGDTREALAATITDPRRDRFAQVLVNRLWKEWMGFGIIDPVDDWEEARPANPELLAWLARELITHGYDLKHVARLILTSQCYQRTPTAAASRVVKSADRLFEAPARRRMNAEQLVDSLFAAAGKGIDSEPLTQDPECRQSAADHGNLGVPRRAWEFAGLSNERDRPALAKPRAMVVADVLATFGWRESRAEPRSTRDQDANVLQPALLANGTFGSRLTRLSEDSAFTALALREQPLPALVSELFLRLLSRPPTPDESTSFQKLLEPGYAARLTGAAPQPPPPRNPMAVSWANHLNPDASRVVMEIEQQVKAGDAPTARLQAPWRERMEDALWALMLTPEFIHLP